MNTHPADQERTFAAVLVPTWSSSKDLHRAFPIESHYSVLPFDGGSLDCIRPQYIGLGPSVHQHQSKISSTIHDLLAFHHSVHHSCQSIHLSRRLPRRDVYKGTQGS